MRPAVSHALPTLTRRGFGARLAIGAAVIGTGAPVRAAAPQPLPLPDPALRDAALRGLALAGHRGDPVTAAAARAAMERLAATDPEGALLARLYRTLDVRPSAYYAADRAPAAQHDLALLHRAIDASAPVGFGYTDLSGNETERTVLPLALVHPPQGVKLLAYCLQAEGYRQFFVREMRDLALGDGDFAADRMALLSGLVEKEAA